MTMLSGTYSEPRMPIGRAVFGSHGQGCAGNSSCKSVRSSTSIELLRAVPLFQYLDNTVLQKIAVKTSMQTIDKNYILIHEGEPSDALYMILSGKVRVYIHDDDEGRRLTFELLGPGECFGELGLIDGASRSATVMAIEETTVLRLDHRDFTELMRDNPTAVMNLLKVLVRRLRGVNEHVFDLALLDVYGRVARMLIRLAKSTENGRIIYPISQQEIANLVGASREMVCRVLNDLKASGYISMKPMRITILSPPPNTT